MLQPGTQVTWNGGSQHGHVTDVFTRTVTFRLQGSQVSRRDIEDTPSYLIQLPDGEMVLKPGNELIPTSRHQ